MRGERRRPYPSYRTVSPAFTMYMASRDPGGPGDAVPAVNSKHNANARTGAVSDDDPVVLAVPGLEIVLACLRLPLPERTVRDDGECAAVIPDLWISTSAEGRCRSCNAAGTAGANRATAITNHTSMHFMRAPFPAPQPLFMLTASAAADVWLSGNRRFGSAVSRSWLIGHQVEPDCSPEESAARRADVCGCASSC